MAFLKGTPIILLLSVVTLHAQSDEYVSPIIDAFQKRQKQVADDYFRQEQLKLQREQLQLAREQQEQQLQLAREQQEQLTRNRPSKPGQAVGTDAAERIVELEFEVALLQLRGQYPDFVSYEGKITELANAFLPGRSTTSRQYLEGLYILAKYSPERPKNNPPVPPPQSETEKASKKP